jgi:DNA repair exonuclease SbcCD ATPase subunit
MSDSEIKFSLSKDEVKLFSSMMMFGAQTKRELLLSTDLHAEKAEGSLSSLLNKGLIREDEETQVFSPYLPLKNISTMLNESTTAIEKNKRDEAENFQQYRKITEEELENFHDSLGKQLSKFNDFNNQLQATLKEELESREEERANMVKKIVDEMISAFSESGSKFHSETQTAISTESINFEKNWTKAVDRFQTIPEIGIRILKESLTHYEEELANIIKSAIEKITSHHSQLLNIVASIEAESTSQVQEFLVNAESASVEMRTNLNTGLHESRKHEKEFMNEIKQQVQVSLVDDVTKALKGVVSDLAKDIDKGINDALIAVKQQTDAAIAESSKQIKSEFKEFAENASELIQEQRPSLGVLNTELTELSTVQKLDTITSTFKQQLQSHLTTDLNALETYYRRVQNSVTDIMENIRRDAKNRLIQQNSDFERLISSFKEVIEKSVARREMEAVRLQQISQSVDKFLHNILVSIPMRSNHFKTTTKDSIENTRTKVQETIDKSIKSAVNDIYSILTSSQKRIESVVQETMEESQREIQNVVTSSEQLGNTVSNLQDQYTETIESRFEQRAKVMNTELEAVARNFQQVLNGIESGVGDINERLASEAKVVNIETSLQKSISQLENEIETTFSQNQSESREFLNQIDSSFQNHLDNTFNLIKEGFNQLKKDFTGDLESKIVFFNEKNEDQQNKLITAIATFWSQSSGQFDEFKTNLSKAIEENQKAVINFISENRRGTDEVIDLHKSNITKYQEKGPTDILSFINQIETEVSTQNKNLKDALEELTSYYSGLTDSTMSEITVLLRQVHESGEKLDSAFEDSLHVISNSLDSAGENIDLFFSDSITEIENQIGVTTGFVTSEVATSANLIQDEIQILKDEMEEKVSQLNSEMKELVTHQDQEFQTQIPELNQEFSKVFDELIENRSESNRELEQKAEENLSTLITKWKNQLETMKTKLTEVTNAVDQAIEANIENIEVIVKTNVEQAIKRINTIYDLDTSKEDIFGLREIKTKVKQASKRLKSAIADSLKSHVERFDNKLPELITSYEAIHNQIEEDLNNYMEDLGDLILSSQATVTKQLHEYLKEESQVMDFSEVKEELSSILRDYSQTTTQNIESLSSDLADTVRLSIKDVDNTRNEIQEMFSSINSVVGEKNTNLLEYLTELKTDLLQNAEKGKLDTIKEINTSLDTYKNNLEKDSLALSGKASQLIKTVNEDLEKQISRLLKNSHELLKDLVTINKFSENLHELDSEISRTKPLTSVRLVKLATDEAKNEYIRDMIKAASKQVTIFTSNPTFLSVSDLKAIPSDKRIWIFTSFDFTKKGKRWVSEIGEQVNINLRKAKSKKLSGLLVVQDQTAALVLPDTLGFTTSDSKIVEYFSGLLSLLKGTPLQTKSKSK